jgi:dUTP pyrophosphatase
MNDVAVAITRLPNAEGIPLPAYATNASAGLDLAAAVDNAITLSPGARALVPTGFAIALPEGYEAQIRPRSGIAVKCGVTVLNAPGTIDADYRGEIKISLINLGTDPFPINRGDRIAQMVIAPVSRTIWEQAETLADTERGSGGFGSTGIKKQSSGKKEAPLS